MIGWAIQGHADERDLRVVCLNKNLRAKTQEPSSPYSPKSGIKSPVELGKENAEAARAFVEGKQHATSFFSVNPGDDLDWMEASIREVRKSIRNQGREAAYFQQEKEFTKNLLLKIGELKSQGDRVNAVEFGRLAMDTSRALIIPNYWEVQANPQLLAHRMITSHYKNLHPLEDNHLSGYFSKLNEVLALSPYFVLFPTHHSLGFSELNRLAGYPICPVGLVKESTPGSIFADGTPNSSVEFFTHDIGHSLSYLIGVLHELKLLGADFRIRPLTAAEWARVRTHYEEMRRFSNPLLDQVEKIRDNRLRQSVDLLIFFSWHEKAIPLNREGLLRYLRDDKNFPSPGQSGNHHNVVSRLRDPKDLAIEGGTPDIAGARAWLLKKIGESQSS